MNYLIDLNINNENIVILPPRLSIFDQVVENSHIDYVGTRLHACIRALHMNKRIIIIGVDNCAMEKAKDFNIPVIERNNINELESMIGSSFETKINIPYKNIACWRNQFVV